MNGFKMEPVVPAGAMLRVMAMVMAMVMEGLTPHLAENRVPADQPHQAVEVVMVMVMVMEGLTYQMILLQVVVRIRLIQSLQFQDQVGSQVLHGLVTQLHSGKNY